jgi:hypothetical protein
MIAYLIVINLSQCLALLLMSNSAAIAAFLSPFLLIYSPLKKLINNITCEVIALAVYVVHLAYNL